MVFWEENLDRLNIRHLLDYSVPEVLIFSDASEIGCGAWSVQHNNVKFFQNWNLEERTKSSTWRELQGVFLGLKAFHPYLKGKTVKVFTDKTGVQVIMKKGSMKADLQTIAIEITEFSKNREVVLGVKWVSRTRNVKADYLSRCEDFDDWEVSYEFFGFVDGLWRPHSVDRFADEYNHNKLPVFNSKYWCSASSQVDAFACHWAKI